MDKVTIGYICVVVFCLLVLIILPATRPGSGTIKQEERVEYLCIENRETRQFICTPQRELKPTGRF